MTTIEKIQQLSDNEVLSLYQGFSTHLRKQIQVDAADVIKNPPEDLLNLKDINFIQQKDLDKLDSIVKAEEVISVVRILMEQWANDPSIAPVLDEFMESYPINTMDAGIILALGSVMLMAIVSTSLKVEYKEGNLSISYDSSNISDNAVEMVKAVVTKIPETLKNILP